MTFLLDENVSLILEQILREHGHIVLAVCEFADRGIPDTEVWSRIKDSETVLITRDYHFTNPYRFPSTEVGGIIFIRSANLKAIEEATLVENFITHYPFDSYKRKLVTLSRNSVKIR